MKVVGVDIGSSAIKACTFEFGDGFAPRLLEKFSQPCPLSRPEPGWAEHNLEKMESQLVEVMSRVTTGIPISFASAMHGLVVLDKAGHPLTDAISWADLRSAREAAALKELFPNHQKRTGTPIHPMAWPAKLRWLRLRRPVWWNQIARITGLKGYLLERLLGFPVPLDVSNASATGLWDQQDQGWDEELLEHLDIPPKWLPEVQTGINPFLWKGRQLYLGGGDGPLGNLGVGATKSSRIAISVGTSGAVRQPDSGGPLQPSLFRYAIDHHMSVRGGAISNGSSVLDWLSAHYGQTKDEILKLAESVEPDPDGPLVYPYFSGERAPFWDSTKRAAIRGLGFSHAPQHVYSASLEGIAFCLRRILEQLTPSSEPLRCTGGLFSSPFWTQLLANVTGKPVAVSPVEEATSLGAALMATKDYLARSVSLPAGDAIEPVSARKDLYEEKYQRWLAMEDPTPE